MKDKSLNVLLLVIFGITGAVILMLAWLEPMSVSERALTTIIGSVGIFMALTRAMMLKSQARTGTGQVPVEVKDKP